MPHLQDRGRADHFQPGLTAEKNMIHARLIVAEESVGKHGWAMKPRRKYLEVSERRHVVMVACRLSQNSEADLERIRFYGRDTEVADSCCRELAGHFSFLKERPLTDPDRTFGRVAEEVHAVLRA